jgi:hypothetical protein
MLMKVIRTREEITRSTLMAYQILYALELPFHLRVKKTKTIKLDDDYVL